MRNALAAIVAAIRAALGGLVSRVISTTRSVGGRLVTFSETVWETSKSLPGAALNLSVAGSELAWEGAKALPAAALDVTARTLRSSVAVPLAIAEAAVKAPLLLARSVLGGGGGGGAPASEGQAATSAEQRAEVEQAKADAAGDARAQVQALRRVASSLAKGVRPEPESLELLSPKLVAYLRALEPEECAALVRTRTTALRQLLDKGTAPANVRGPAEVAECQAASQAAPAAAPRPDLKFRIAARRRDQAAEILEEWGARA